MTQTQAEAAVMRQTADRFEQVEESLRSMLNGLKADLEVLQTAWQGAGGRSFEQVKQQWTQNQETLQRALRETAAGIRTAGQRYEAADAEAAGRIANTNRGLTLPL
ncbi:WXG100 family type VII secretion target [Polymorphospora rubra]|uniref:WXG100 family type VII secretion target n=1 Tax=Polymorphospora rubra TaxID=338584 RepID=UPI0033FAC91D